MRKPEQNSGVIFLLNANMKNEKHADYYEAILQIRPAREDVVDFVLDAVEKRNDVKISKVVELKTGIDFYLTNQRFSRGALARALRKKFKGIVKITKKIYGVDRQTSRVLYRATILFRLR